jgi:F0F1-type ATP synthase membrane subunit b/b'
MNKSGLPKGPLFTSMAVALLCACLGAVAWAKNGRDGDDRGSRVEDRADRGDRTDRDASRATERTQRDEQRFQEERTKIMQDAAKDPEKAARELAKLEEERQEELLEAQEEAAEEAAEAAEELAENGGMSGSSRGMQDIGKSENPDHDSRGYPIRRGEVVALDLSRSGLAKAQAKGYRLIEREELQALDGSITRLAVPPGTDPETAIDEMARIEPAATFDYTHYYGLQVSPSGTPGKGTGSTLPRKSGNFTVGMIDTGVASHTALQGPSISTRDFSKGNEAIPTGHGTAVASILVSEGAKSLFVANIFRGGTGTPFTSAEAIASALEWLVSNKVPVINMSLSGPRNAILDRLIDRSAAKGTIVVAAAGNSGPAAPPAYPAALPKVIAVTAVDANLRVYRYANQGSYLDVAARGVNEPAAKAGGGTGLFSGTSYATPHIAAWLASCRTGTSSDACNRQLLSNARDLGTPGHDPVYGHGYVR